MYCRSYTGTVSCVLCREVYSTVSLFGRAHYQRFCSIYTTLGGNSPQTKLCGRDRLVATSECSVPKNIHSRLGSYTTRSEYP